MPSFDVISEVDKHELTNAVDQASRELTNRFDFKGVDATFELNWGDVPLRLSRESDTWTLTLGAASAPVPLRCVAL